MEKRCHVPKHAAFIKAMDGEVKNGLAFYMRRGRDRRYRLINTIGQLTAKETLAGFELICRQNPVTPSRFRVMSRHTLFSWTFSE